VCGAYLCVGYSQLTAQQLARAQDAFRAAIRHSRFSGADVLENMAHAGLAIAKIYSGEDNALADLEQALVRARRINDPMGSAMIAQELGGIYARRGDTARAESFLKNALEYFRRAQMEPYVTRTLEMLKQLNVAR